MDKRYQVFVSSTFTDLEDERKEVIQALLELDCIPSGMELFPAADDDQWTLIKKVIDDCDYYIIIIAGRYGSLGPTGKSYTQMEYEYALSQGKPIISFIHENPGHIPADKTEMSDQGKLSFANFRDLVKQKMCKYWTTSDGLGSVVSRSLIQLIKTRPAVGWVRADLVPGEGFSQEILRLKNRIEELEGQIICFSTEAPQGTDLLRQGQDDYPIHYKVYVSNPDYGYTVDTDNVISFSWDSMFKKIAPHMEDNLGENAIKGLLEDKIEESHKEFINNQMDNGDYSQGVIIKDEDFQTIKIQLKALGLITKKGDSGNWCLTPYGENYMTKLIALHKDEDPDYSCLIWNPNDFEDGEQPPYGKRRDQGV